MENTLKLIRRLKASLPTKSNYATAKAFADAFRIAAEPITQPSPLEDDATTQITPSPTNRSRI